MSFKISADGSIVDVKTGFLNGDTCGGVLYYAGPPTRDAPGGIYPTSASIERNGTFHASNPRDGTTFSGRFSSGYRTASGSFMLSLPGSSGVAACSATWKFTVSVGQDAIAAAIKKLERLHGDAKRLSSTLASEASDQHQVCVAYQNAGGEADFARASGPGTTVTTATCDGYAAALRSGRQEAVRLVKRIMKSIDQLRARSASSNLLSFEAADAQAATAVLNAQCNQRSFQETLGPSSGVLTAHFAYEAQQHALAVNALRRDIADLPQ